MEKRLTEIVPFERGHQLYAKFRPMTPGTFGCDIEYKAGQKDFDPRDYESEIEDSIIRTPSQWRANQDAYYEWLEDTRKNDNRRYAWRKDWDDSHGPIDEDTWLEHHPEPEREEYNTDEEFDLAHDEWDDNRNDVRRTHASWERRDKDDYVSEWVSSLIKAGEWQRYSNWTPPDTGENTNEEIENAVHFIRYELHQSVIKGSAATSAVWAVGEDAEGVVEIRTRHMKDEQGDYELMEDILSFVYNKDTGGDTSAHVHIGLPQNFSAFDILAMADLVDEKKVQMDVGNDRDWRQFSQLAYELHGAILRIVGIQLDIPQNRLSDLEKNHPGWTISNEKLLDILKRISKHMGTNLAAFADHGTVEFRYFSSYAASHNINLFLRWIKYFMTIPKIAQRRNSIIVGKSRTGAMRFERLPNNDVFIRFDKATSAKPDTAIQGK